MTVRKSGTACFCPTLPLVPPLTSNGLSLRIKPFAEADGARTADRRTPYHVQCDIDGMTDKGQKLFAQFKI